MPFHAAWQLGAIHREAASATAFFGMGVAFFPLRGSEQIGQLGDGRRDCSRLVPTHEIARVARLRREVDIRYSEMVGVADDVGDGSYHDKIWVRLIDRLFDFGARSRGFAFLVSAYDVFVDLPREFLEVEQHEHRCADALNLVDERALDVAEHDHRFCL